MKVIQHIQEAKDTLFSLEILPPLKGQNISSIFETMDKLMEFQPAFVDVTYHREEYVFRDAGNGLLEKHVVKKRPGTVGICAAVTNRYRVDTVPHIICGGFSRQDTEDALIDLNFVGIDNVLVLRGDPIKSEGRFKPENEGHAFASELVEQVVKMNQGLYLDPDLKDVQRTNFCIGVAGYPEKHLESPSLTSDLKRLKEKVDAGADYVVTQMFFDNAKFFEFVAKAREIGINVPIIPGIKPIAVHRHLQILPQIFRIDLPEDLINAVEKCKTPADIRHVGVEWAIQQSLELKAAGVPFLHYYSMGKSENIRQIASKVF